jgi:hypothetical protein
MTVGLTRSDAVQSLVGFALVRVPRPIRTIISDCSYTIAYYPILVKHKIFKSFRVKFKLTKIQVNIP